LNHRISRGHRERRNFSAFADVQTCPGCSPIPLLSCHCFTQDIKLYTPMVSYLHAVNDEDT
jgi:hypothetical protein